MQTDYNKEYKQKEYFLAKK